MNTSKIRSYLPEGVTPSVDGLRNFDDGKVALIGISGKKGSGKDTLAALLSEKMAADGIVPSLASFAGELKKETTSIIDSFRMALGVKENKPSPREAATRLSKLYRLSPDQLLRLYDLIKKDLKAGLSPTGWTRSQEIWDFLRILGTDFRQPQDKYYWVRKTMEQALSNSSNMKSTIITDARFIHEADPILEVGGFLVRVDISDEAQERRLRSRDGLMPTIDALSHRSETELDDYTKFSLRVDNSMDGQMEELAEKVYEEWKAFQSLKYPSRKS